MTDLRALATVYIEITLMADGYSDVVLITSARFDIEQPLKMQGADDDVDEITNGSDLVLSYDVQNTKYAESLVNALNEGSAKVTIGEGRTTVADNGKVTVENGVLTLTFENIKDSLKKDTQYTVTFPTLDYNDADKLGMTASLHYAPATEAATESLEEKETTENPTVFETVVKDAEAKIDEVPVLPEVNEEVTVEETEETTVEEVTEATTVEEETEVATEEVTVEETTEVVTE